MISGPPCAFWIRVVTFLVNLLNLCSFRLPLCAFRLTCVNKLYVKYGSLRKSLHDSN